jgi:hypothetical protein
MIARRSDTETRNDVRVADSPDFSAAESLLRNAAMTGAASDALTLVVTLAAVTPIIQLMLSTTSATGASYQQALNTNANLEAASLSILTESVNKLLRPAQPVVYQQAPAPLPQQPQAEKLAVS